MKTLLIGNTGYVTRELIETAFPGDTVVVIGNPALKSDKKHRITSYGFSMEDAYAESTVKGCYFDKVVYFSNYLTMHGSQLGELERIQRMFTRFWLGQGAQIVYLTACDSCCAEASGRRELVKVAIALFVKFSEKLGLHPKILRIPYLYSDTYEEDYLCQVLKSLDEKKKVKLDVSREDYACFLSGRDLGILMQKVFHAWNDRTEILNVSDTARLRFADLENALRQIDRSFKITFTGTPENRQEPDTNEALLDRYGWTQSWGLTGELREMYESVHSRSHKKISLGQRLKAWPEKHRRLVAAVELAAGFLCTELAARLAASSVPFRTVDFRLLFIVIMSSIYGMNAGIAAAVLAGIALTGVYVENGMDWVALFYEPTNWLPFIAYFAAGILCGYVRLKNQDELLLVKNENALLQDKFLTLKGLYRDTLDHQKAYKKQILSARDSFGKIFEITKKLDSDSPRQILDQAVEVLEQMLENETIAIYTVDRSNRTARLAACSKAMSGSLEETLSLPPLRQALEWAELGEVWVNRDLRQDHPMYLAQIHGAGEEVLILVYGTSFSQNGIHYTNLIKVLCGLIESALSRAAHGEALERLVP